MFLDKKNQNKEKPSWILLKRTGKGPVFKQAGPYRKGQILDFLRSGCCSSRDFVYTEHFTKWRRISVVPEFPSHPGQTISDLLTQQSRKYKIRPMRSVRYSPSQQVFDWSEVVAYNR